MLAVVKKRMTGTTGLEGGLEAAQAERALSFASDPSPAQLDNSRFGHPREVQA